jgi:hypothetical protein
MALIENDYASAAEPTDQLIDAAFAVLRAGYQ